MNEAATKIIVDGFLRGGFDIYEALLGLAFRFEPGDSADASVGDVSAALDANPVCMQAKVSGGGAIAVLLTAQDASKIVSITNTGEAVESDTVDDASMGTLKEISDSALGAGVENLATRFEQPFELESTDLLIRSVGDAGALLEYIGAGAVLTPFTFSAAPHFDGQGIIINSAAFEDRIPAVEEAGAEALVSEDEMKDILSGFSPDQETAPYAGRDVRVPENLDMVLGISLTATARLGRVEMPIGDVLNIGPGSIIELGKLVDDPVELLVNGRLIARGDVVVVDEKFGLRITEIISPQQRIESLG